MSYDFKTAITVDPSVVAKATALVCDRAFGEGKRVDRSITLVALQVAPELGDRGELQAIEFIANPCSEPLFALLPEKVWSEVDPLARADAYQYRNSHHQSSIYLPEELDQGIVREILRKSSKWEYAFSAVSSGRKCLWSPENLFHGYCDSPRRVAEVISDGRARFYRFIPPGIVREGRHRFFQTIRLYFFLHHKKQIALTIGGVSIEAPTRNLGRARLRAVLVH